MKIGYQGDLFSNSEEASKLFVKKLQFCSFSLIPLTSSQNVVKNLISGNIDYGVMAIENIIAGPVIETKEALTNQIDLIDTLSIPIHHSLFSKHKNTNIQFVASHIQALNQTENNRKKFWKNLKEIECKDTALAAQLLSNGTYPDDYAVICRTDAGKFYNLHLIKENIEDNPNNKTFFGLFILKK